MRIRIRTPDGASTISLPDDATVSALKAEIAAKTSETFDLKHGFPPKPLDLDQWSSDVKLADTGVKFNGEQLIAHPRESSQNPSTQPSATASNPPPQSASAASTVPKPPPANSDDPPEVPVASQGATCVMRVMPDDNSCLFRAISSALMSELDGTVSELRSIVASKIQMDPEFYTAAILEKPPDEYCRWISKESSWGGAIELRILAEHFEVEIATLNVQDGQLYRFNEGKPTRCILVYSGIHYDVIALSPSEPPHTRADLPMELDVKIFSSFDDIILDAARELTSELQKRHYYVDTAKFSIICGDCGWKGNGEAAAQKHAKTTGHYNFSEYGA